MLDKNTIIKVTNRSNGSTGYAIPDLGNLQRVFQSGETKELTMEELRKLSYIPGGMFLLKNNLVLDNPEAVAELLNEVEPEYYYTEEDIKTLLTTGTLAQFEDCLDFAPEGTINLVKKLSVDLELNDVSKRKALLEKTGFNVTSAIEANQMDEEEVVTETKTRRAAAINQTPLATTSGRRSAPVASKYKVVSTLEK
jgi:hypothetical protein